MSQPPQPPSSAGSTNDAAVESAFVEWLDRRGMDPSVGYLALYDIAGQLLGTTALELDGEVRRALALRALPVIYPGTVLVQGATSGERAVVVDHDPSWPATYEVWRKRIVDVLGDDVRVEHVGSTSVPGLAAKPIVDIQISVRDVADEESYVPALESIGLQFRARDDVHRYLRREEDGRRELHVHVCEHGSEWESDHLDFRDHLRHDAEARRRYAELKRRLADVWGHDRMAYTEAKGDLIQELLAQARSRPPGADTAPGRAPRS